MKQTTDLSKLRNTYQFNADYASPAGKSGNLSFGYQILRNHENETYHSIISNPAPPAETKQETEFIETIQAGYGTWQYKKKKLDLTAGLRAENLNRSLTTLTNQYPAQHFNLYPSLNSSFSIDSIQKIRFNYSRRTDQLKSNMLDPLPRWYDLYNVIVGNPNLKNEIINKITLGYLVNFKKLTLDDELFYTSTNDNVELIRSIYKDGIIQNRYENTGTYNSFGNELNADWNTFTWLNLNQKIAFISTRLDGMLDGVSLQKKFHQWYFATTADFVLSPSTTLQLDFSYYGPNTSAQSSIDQYCVVGLSFRQTFFDKKLTFTMTGRDFLGLYKTVEHIQGDGFNQDITTETIFPIRFSLSYKFNRYKRDERRTAKTPLAD
jgi:hypothetical protein